MVDEGPNSVSEATDSEGDKKAGAGAGPSLPDGVEWRDLKVYIGPQADEHYQHNFTIFRTNGGRWRPTWNGAAFFVAPFWLVYRKMYILAGFIGLGMILIPYAQLVIPLLFVPFADYLYFRKAVGEIADFKKSHPDWNDRDLANLGGVNQAAWVVYLLFAGVMIAAKMGLSN